MKSFVAYPSEFDTLLFPPQTENNNSGKLIAHYELFRKVSHLNGAIVKCGITVEEGFKRFVMFKEMAGSKIEQKMIAFEKLQSLFQEVVTKEGEMSLKVVERNGVSLSRVATALVETGLTENIDFAPGLVSEAIPQYLIENPELKIALLNIDLDEYEATLTTLEFLYPRLMPGGILIIDNYYKSAGEQKALMDYFATSKATINNFSVNNGPHYIVKP